MESKIKELAQQQGLKNVQQFSLKAGLPWTIAKNIWAGNLENRALKTLVAAATALDVSIEDLFEVSE